MSSAYDDSATESSVSEPTTGQQMLPVVDPSSNSEPSTGAPTATSSSNTTSAGETKPSDSANVCNEPVPAERHVDGIPAYAQCAESESVAIWSDDGINTSATQQSAWRRTQWGGGYQCTEFASRYLYFVWGVERVPNGDAGTWCDEEPPDGLVQSLSPVHGDLIVFAPGSCGASPETGHVAVVDTVDENNARVVIVEQNRAGRRTTDIECAACFLHAVGNDAL